MYEIWECKFGRADRKLALFHLKGIASLRTHKQICTMGFRGRYIAVLDNGTLHDGKSTVSSMRDSRCEIQLVQQKNWIFCFIYFFIFKVFIIVYL